MKLPTILLGIIISLTIPLIAIASHVTSMPIATSPKSTQTWGVNLAKITIIESRGNPLAHNKGEDARGLLQIRKPALDDYNFYNKTGYTMNDLFDPQINIKVGNWYLNDRIPKMIKYYGKEDTIRNRIIAYNAGISYVKNDKPLPTTTKKYLQKYFGGGK